MMVLGLIFIIALIYFVAKPHHHMGIDAVRGSEAEETLKKRYVVGEIDEETFRRMLRALKSN